MHRNSTRQKKDQKLELSNLKKAVKAAQSNSQEAASNVLRGITDLNSAKTEFDRYYNGLIFPSMTQVDDESLNKLGENRDELLKDIQGTPNDSATRKHMLDDLVLPYFSRVAADSGYHPAVRLNAVLILGGVNRRDGQRNVEASVPLESAMRTLINFASAADTPPYLKIGALAGILRHAGIDGQLPSTAMEPGQRDQAIQLAISILDATTTPVDGQPLTDEQYWMRRQAVQILGAFRAPGADGKAVAALRKILDDPNAPLWLAADAVEAYGKINFTADPAQADVANVAKSIALIVNRFLKADVQAIDDYVATIKENRMIEKRSVEKLETATSEASGDEMGDASGAGGAGRGGGAKGQSKGAAAAVAALPSAASVQVPNYKINDVRQRTKAIVFAARVALDGVAPRRKNELKPPENLKSFVDKDKDPATIKMIDQVTAALDKVMEQTDLAPVKAIAPTAQVRTGEAPKKPETNDERLRNALNVCITTLDSLISAAPAGQQPVTVTPAGG